MQPRSGRPKTRGPAQACHQPRWVGPVALFPADPAELCLAAGAGACPDRNGQGLAAAAGLSAPPGASFSPATGLSASLSSRQQPFQLAESERPTTLLPTTFIYSCSGLCLNATPAVARLKLPPSPNTPGSNRDELMRACLLLASDNLCVAGRLPPSPFRAAWSAQPDHASCSSSSVRLCLNL